VTFEETDIINKIINFLITPDINEQAKFAGGPN